MSGNCHGVCFSKPVLWTAARGGAFFCFYFLQAQLCRHLGDEILDVGHDALGQQASPVRELVHGKLRHIHRVEIHRADRAVGQNAEGGGHVPRGDGVQHGGHADDGGGLAHLGPHGVLPLIDVAHGLRQGTVVPDAAHQDKGDVFVDTGADDAVVQPLGLHKSGDAAALPHPVEGVQMVIVSVEQGGLGVDVGPQGGVEIGSLQVVGSQGVARQDGLDIAVFDELAESLPRRRVKGKGRAHHPGDKAPVLLFILEQLGDLLVIPGKAGLTGAALAEGKVVFFAGGTGHPYFSTDTGAVLRAIEIEADAMLIAKAIDGIYDSDPKVNKEAKKYEEISIQEIIDKKLMAVDLTASIMCLENKMPMLVFGLNEENSIVETMTGTFTGTKVTV